MVFEAKYGCEEKNHLFECCRRGAATIVDATGRWWSRGG